MYNKNTSWFTIVEVIIASFFVSLIFTWLFAWITVISSYVNKSNIKLVAMNIAKSAMERVDLYKRGLYLSSSWDQWGVFIWTIQPGYYVFNGTGTNLNLKNEDLVSNFKNWEGPLDSSGSGKTNTDGISYYRILKIADYDMNGTTSNLSIFDCNTKDEKCNTWITKKNLSDPYLSWVTFSPTELKLEFSTGKIFNTPSLFLNYIGTGTVASWTLAVSTDILVSSWVISNIGQVYYLDFSWSTTTGSLLWKFITLSWSQLPGLKFVFWTATSWEIPVSTWDSIDTAIFNLKVAISSNLDNFIPFILYPNKCSIWDVFTIYDTISDTKNNFKVDLFNNCNNINTPIINQNILTLSWTLIQNLNKNMTISPWYKLKFNLNNSPNDYTLFSNLVSPRVTNYWVSLNNWSWKSSVYILWVKVLWVENGKIVTEEIFQNYIVDL